MTIAFTIITFVCGPGRIEAAQGTLGPYSIKEAPVTSAFKLAPLPWNENALEPAISAKTISFHYHKHHNSYVETLNKLVQGSKFADMKLEQVVRESAAGADAKEKKIFNNAGQVWNHDFYWRSLTPSRTEPSGRLASAIARDFGQLSSLIAELAEAGKNQFGS